jgi:hypothetical protein
MHHPRCRRAVLELAADRSPAAPRLQPLIGDPPWGHKIAVLDVKVILTGTPPCIFHQQFSI